MEAREKLAELFDEMAGLLELAGANPFKIRAYQNAARTLQTNPVPLQQLLDEPPKGFGASMCGHVKEFLETGRVAERDQLEASFPPGLFGMMRVPGLGPKKVRLLYDQLGIDDLEKLEAACRGGNIAGLKGFGEKTAANILNGIEFIRRFAGRFLLATARETADQVMAWLKREAPGAEYHVAGSLRRCRETVKDIDILAATDGGSAVMAAFLRLPGIVRVVGTGETKTSVVLESGMQVDLRVVPPESLGPALCHFTGSKEHNTLMRSLALSKRLKLNEYGLYDGETAAPMATEQEVYEALGLSWVAPELREGMDEIEWAGNGRLPVLVEAKDLRGAIHAHTNASDGAVSLEEMAEAAAGFGWSWLGISDHSVSAHYAHGIDEVAIERQWREIDAWNAAHGRRCRLLKGIESDIRADGALDYPPETLAGFDFVIASVHSGFTMPREEMTRRVIRAVENPFTSVLGHPEGRLLLAREGYEIDIERVLDACVANRVAVEINAQPQRLDLDWRHIRAWRDRGLTFVIGPDAHDPASLEYIRYGLGIARKGGLEARHLLNALSGGELLDWLRKARMARKGN
ncbi:MAG TPA: DNA polymerase/3'-5' exonuclease PolX [Candidatus Ozemobacteraceae bacterium]|nr:DNA polymerase/3'-5' exonuclease PolX [Candidatus Ozemobacteraceae bacterium]